jgi:hypothetical protein
LAEQEKPVKTFRALCNHDYCVESGTRLLDDGLASTGGKCSANMQLRIMAMRDSLKAIPIPCQSS